MKDRIDKSYNESYRIMEDVARRIYEFNELGDKEFNSSNYLVNILNDHGYKVSPNYCGLDTAFMASVKNSNSKAVIAILAEYDALPNIGHGCGHNLISSMTLGTALAIKEIIEEIPIELRVIGTPAEETTAGKVKMVDTGAFDDVDCVMMCHPFNSTGVWLSGLAVTGIEYIFHGKTSHASSSPEKGKNALQAMINFFNNINGIRLELDKTSSIHGIITYGGEAPNIIPDLSKSKFNIRSDKIDKLEELLKKVEKLTESAAISTGTTCEINQYLKPIYDIKTNDILGKLLELHMEECGLQKMTRETIALGSSDIGNVSYVCPTVHGMVNVTEKEIDLHTKEFAENTLTNYALEQSVKASKAMAYTIAEIAQNLDLIEYMKNYQLKEN